MSLYYVHEMCKMHLLSMHWLNHMASFSYAMYLPDAKDSVTCLCSLLSQYFSKIEGQGDIGEQAKLKGDSVTAAVPAATPTDFGIAGISPGGQSGGTE